MKKKTEREKEKEQFVCRKTKPKIKNLKKKNNNNKQQNLVTIN